MYCQSCRSVCCQDQQLIEDFCLHLEGIRSCSEETARTYKSDLNQFASFLFDRGVSLPEVTVREINAYVQFLDTHGISARTATRKLYAFGTFYKRLVKENVIGIDPTAFVDIKKNWSNKPRFRTEEEMRKFLDAARSRAFGPHSSALARLLAIRNWAIKEYLYGSGVRRAECCGIDLSDVNFEELSGRVLGKGNKERKTSLTATACEALHLYLKLARPGLLQRRSRKTSPSRALFLTSSGTRMSRGSLNKITNGITPHEFRHSHAQHVADHGASLSYIQEQLGHVTIDTTAIYAGHVNFNELEQVHMRCHPRRSKRGRENSEGKEGQQ